MSSPSTGEAEDSSLDIEVSFESWDSERGGAGATKLRPARPARCSGLARFGPDGRPTGHLTCYEKRTFLLAIDRGMSVT